MKLIKRTYMHTAIWLLPVVLIGSVFCFCMIKHIVYEETDEFLTYEMERLIEYHQSNKSLPEFHKVADIIEGLKYEKPVFKDTLILEPGDNELVPHRDLYFSIDHKGQDFTIVLRHLLLGNDDILEGTLYIIVGFFFLVTLILFFMVNSISEKIWRPFYKTLNTLTKYQLTKSLPVFEQSKIDEFNTLSNTVQTILNKIACDYRRTKEFNENASHELQTHLAIIRANTERMLNQTQQTYNPEQLQTIYNATVKLSNIQKSLLLLSKIGNLEYNNNVRVNMADVLQRSVQLFSEASDIRNISVNTTITPCVQVMDAGLAEILINNLLKNAVKHNVEGGHIVIHLTQNMLSVENTGQIFDGNPESLLERFTKGENGNLGVGLSIVKQICDLYQFDITYNIEANKHIIKVLFCQD